MSGNGCSVEVDLERRERRGSLVTRSFERLSSIGDNFGPAECEGRGGLSWRGMMETFVVDLGNTILVLSSNTAIDFRPSMWSVASDFDPSMWRVGGVELVGLSSTRSHVLSRRRRQGIPSTRGCPFQRRRRADRSPDRAATWGTVHYAVLNVSFRIVDGSGCRVCSRLQQTWF